MIPLGGAPGSARPEGRDSESTIPSRCRARQGFTLVELIVATVVIAGIASAVTVSISQSLRAKSNSGSRSSAMLRADAAAGRIALDVQNVVREGDLYLARVLVIDKERDGLARDEILVFTGSTELARPTSSEPEGGAYEVQYRVGEEAGSRGRTRAGEVETMLWRRVDPIPDEMTLGGGVAFPVVEGIIALSIEAFDGEAWAGEWDSDRDGYPHAVRLTVVARSEDGRRTETVRRVVAIDRVPLVYDKEREEGGEE
jgi:type II secretion system protein J